MNPTVLEVKVNGTVEHTLEVQPKGISSVVAGNYIPAGTWAHFSPEDIRNMAARKAMRDYDGKTVEVEYRK